MKKQFSVLLTSLLVISMLGSCSDTGDSSGGTADNGGAGSDVSAPETFTYPMEYDGDPVTIFVNDLFALHKSYTSADESPLHIGIGEHTGLDFDWSFPPLGSDTTQALNLELAKSDLPAAIGNLKPKDVELYIEDGVLIDLTEYLPKYAPNYWAILNDPANEHIRQTYTTDSGQIGLFGFWREDDFGAVWRGPMLRKDILDKEGVDIPETIADWEEVFEAMKRNGLNTVGELGNFDIFLGSGFGAYGTFSKQIYVDNGEVKIAQMQPEWKEYMTKMNEWYEAGYIDPDILTMDDATMKSKVANNTGGIVAGAMSRITYFVQEAENTGNGQEWVGVPFPSEAEGEPACQIWLEDVARGDGIGITTAATEEEIEALCRAFDWFYTEEGNYYINFGEEGVTHTRDADGNLVWTDALLNGAEPLREEITKYATMAGASLGWQRTELVKALNVPQAVDAVETWRANQVAAEHLYPAGVSFTVEEQDDKANYESVIDTYIKECALKFMTGEMDIDTEYDAFLQQLDEIKINELIDIYQAGYDRFNAR